MSGRLSSPRLRRRLLRISAAAVVLVATVAFFVFSPRHHGTDVPEVAPGLTVTTSLDEPTVANPAADRKYERQRRQAEVHAADVSGRLLEALLLRRGLGDVYELVAPKLLGGTSREEWVAGRHLPLPARPDAEPAGHVVAFSGPRSAGIVSAYSAPSVAQDYLYAVRVEEVDGHWVATYIHEGHSAPFVNETTFAPPGFLPGSAVTGRWWWLSIPAFFVVLITVVVLLDRRIGKGAVS